MTDFTALGLSEPELRDALLEELELAFRTERGVTVHGMAHSIARVIALDHLRLAERSSAREFGSAGRKPAAADASASVCEANG